MLEPPKWDRLGWNPEDPIKPPSALPIGFYVVVYGILAVGYGLFRAVVALFTWVIARHIVYGVVGVLALLLLGPFFYWIYSAYRRIYGCSELLVSVLGAYYYSLKFQQGTHDLGVFISLSGAVFLFVKGIEHFAKPRA